MKLIRVACCLITIAANVEGASISVKEALAQIDSVTGKAKAAGEFTLTGIVAARITLPDDRTVAFILNPGEPALAVLTSAQAGASLIPRNEVTFTGKLGDGPFGAALLLNPGSVTVLATNKPFGISELRGGAFFQDASSLAGRYVQLTNVTLSPARFGIDGLAKAKAADGTAVTLVVSKSTVGREAPAEPVNVYGLPIKVGSEWRLVAARFLLVRAKDVQTIAMKRTCLTCHNPDMKLLGPPYREVAAKYRNDPDAVAKLTSQMEKGGVGKWGPVPMPALGALVPGEDRQALAEWIMSYRWDALLAE